MNFFWPDVANLRLSPAIGKKEMVGGFNESYKAKKI
jgi:hypothetical protein